jgi:hypothetical protein
MHIVTLCSFAPTQTTWKHNSHTHIVIQKDRQTDKYNEIHLHSFCSIAAITVVIILFTGVSLSLLWCCSYLTLFSLSVLLFLYFFLSHFNSIWSWFSSRDYGSFFSSLKFIFFKINNLKTFLALFVLYLWNKRNVIFFRFSLDYYYFFSRLNLA